jgi:Cna protein B-type domain.
VVVLSCGLGSNGGGARRGAGYDRGGDGGAEVTLTNVDTGVGVKGKTNDSGFYTFPVVPIGNYKIEASRSGFGSSEQLGLKLDVNQLARIDFTLKPGSLQETVNVSAAAALLDSETSTVGQVIDNKRIVELPLNGRNYLDLAKLAVGTAPSRGGRTALEGGFVASGQHGYQLAINLDGLDNSSVSSGGPLGFEAQAVKPSVDAVSEFRVVTNNLSAEYGGRMGGQVLLRSSREPTSCMGRLSNSCEITLWTARTSLPTAAARHSRNTGRTSLGARRAVPL